MKEFTDRTSEHKNVHTVYSHSAPVQPLLEKMPHAQRQSSATRPIPFNGMLTNKLLAALPGEDCARLLPYLEPVTLVGGEDLYRFAETIDFAYFPETAVVSHIYFMEDGSATAAAIIGREGMIGLSAILDSRTPSYWTKITVGGNALRISTGTLKQEFQRGGALQQLLLAYTSARLTQLSQRAVCNGRHKIDARLCTWLLMVHDRACEKPLPLTHEEIAHNLGTRRSSITTACNALRDSNIIAYHRGMIRILDRSMLEAMACECYRMLKQIC